METQEHFDSFLRQMFEDMTFSKFASDAKRIYQTQVGGTDNASETEIALEVRKYMFRRNMMGKYIDSYLQGMYEGWLLNMYPPFDLDMATELKKRDGKLHVDMWLDMPFGSSTSEGEKMARLIIEHFRMPAWKQGAYESYYKRFKVMCEYGGKIYRVTGASRLGDIWLAEDLNRDMGYDKRVYVNDCSRWTVIDSVAQQSYGDEVLK